jgi:serine protease Do
MDSPSRPRRGTRALRIGLTAALLASAFVASPRVHAIRFWGEEEEQEEKAAEPQAVEPAIPSKQVQAAVAAGLPNFADLAEAMQPAVVNISTTATAESPPMGLGPGPGPGPGPRQFGGPPGGGGQDPFHEFWEPFERYFGPMPRRQKQRSLGSGFILDNTGLIMTNNHVVENAEEIVVQTSSDKEYKAKVVGRDPKTDLAVIKIEADNGDDLKPVVLGNSDELRVGDWIFAIGNPFGLSSTVTAGIVSAKGRYIGQGSYDDFIQTDAAINPGNSGGPLVNLKGEVVGINSAIFSRSGGNIGIGFAIPINLAKELLPQLQEKGRVTRGWLGVYIQRVTSDIAESLKLDNARGALVADVMADTPAAEAGIEVGDVIVEFDGHPVKESTDLPMIVARTPIRTPIGKSAEVKIIRNGRPQTMTVTIGEQRDEEVQMAGGSAGELGMTVQNLTPDIAESLGIDPKTKGVVVASIEPGSAADEAGLQRGDVILEVNRQPVENETAYKKSLQKTEKGKTVLLLVRRGENTIFMALKSPKEE